MFPESAAMAEVQYRQQRFIEEAAAHRLARSARAGQASLPTRTVRLLIPRQRQQASDEATASRRVA